MIYKRGGIAGVRQTKPYLSVFQRRADIRQFGIGKVTGDVDDCLSLAEMIINNMIALPDSGKDEVLLLLERNQEMSDQMKFFFFFL